MTHMSNRTVNAIPSNRILLFHGTEVGGSCRASRSFAMLQLLYSTPTRHVAHKCSPSRTVRCRLEALEHEHRLQEVLAELVSD
jgi:hypothetical protein